MAVPVGGAPRRGSSVPRLPARIGATVVAGGPAIPARAHGGTDGAGCKKAHEACAPVRATTATTPGKAPLCGFTVWCHVEHCGKIVADKA